MVLKEIPTDNITRPLGRNEVIGLLFRLTIFGAVTYFTIKWMVDAIDLTRKNNKIEAQNQNIQVQDSKYYAKEGFGEFCQFV